MTGRKGQIKSVKKNQSADITNYTRNQLKRTEKEKSVNMELTHYLILFLHFLLIFTGS